MGTPDSRRVARRRSKRRRERGQGARIVCGDISGIGDGRGSVACGRGASGVRSAAHGNRQVGAGLELSIGKLEFLAAEALELKNTESDLPPFVPQNNAIFNLHLS